jgi:hypothetical protein
MYGFAVRMKGMHGELCGIASLANRESFPFLIT